MIRPVATLPPKDRQRLASSDSSPSPTGAGSPTDAARCQHPWWFIVLEVVLVLAVPVLGYFGAAALLSTTAGTFARQPLPGEPGWRVLVDPTPVTAIAEVLDSRVTGITIIAQPGGETDGGALVMVPGTLQLDDGRLLEDLVPSDALAALASELRLGFTETFVITPADWSAVIGDAAYEIDNPDPIPPTADMAAVPVGRISVDEHSAAVVLGAAAEGANPLSLLFRRQLLWEAILADPPATDDPVAVLLRRVAAAPDRVDDLPTLPSRAERPGSGGDGRGLLLDDDAAEQLIREIVPLPRGSAPGDRVVIRVVDRTGTNDTRALALLLGARGFEVSEIANAQPFDNGPTQLVVPSLVDIDAMRELAVELGADTVSPDPVEETEVSTVVLLVGSDVDLGE